MSHILVLISCSNGKQRGGESRYRSEDSIAAHLSVSTSQRMLDRRNAIRELILQGAVEDRLRGDGNRVDSRYNLALEPGPDMGATGEGRGLYLPAYRRYDGRFYAHAGEDALETAILNERHTLIVSGLYGLIRLEEPIQAYNCHLDDEIVSDQAGPGCFRIADLWREGDLMTMALKEYIQQANREGRRPVRHVLDLLSEGSYQRIFNWDHLHDWFAEQGIEWGHRVVHGVREPGFLADLGRLFQHEVSGNVVLSEPGKVEHECLRTINEQKGALLLSRDVRLDAFTDTHLLNVLGEKTWKGLAQVAKDELIQGELFFQLYDARSSR